MKVLGAIATALALATSALAQTVVVGTGNPDVDVPAVQAAVDRGGEVVLRGYFSFDRAPTVTTSLADIGFPPAMVLISKPVRISGVHDASIEAGTLPFYVEAPGASVGIQNLRFIHPTSGAILVYAVTGLTITSCKVEGSVPVGGNGSGIWIVTGGIPTPTNPGHPENISGRLVVANNDIDLIGGTASDNKLGVTIFSVGVSPDREVDLYVSGSHISNVTEPAINLRRIGGRAHIQDNVLITGPVSSTRTPRPDAIRVVDIGSSVIAHNSINCEWPDPDSIGIGVTGNYSDWLMEHAVVVDNDVTMSPPDGTVFGSFSAGIEVRGFARDNYVANNRIRGRARAALAVNVQSGFSPGNNAFVLNRVENFEPSVADVVIDTGVTDTLILGQRGTVHDKG